MLASIDTCDLSKFKSTHINKKLNILALDNEKATLTALKLLVEALGHRLVAFSSSKEVLECLESNDYFDIALIDFRIPGKDNGLSIVEKISELSSSTKCFLVTGENYIENIDSEISVVNKPLTNKKLERIFDHSFNPPTPN